LLSTANTFNLNLSADLVVLSGCNTSLGKQIKGEGLVGLTSGLMYAGSKQVVSSLWPVSDRVTADLMAAFYTGMLQEKLSPAIALRRAQLKILQNPETASPYYWAAFGIQGV
jgi:CHAT domain-containing protein